MATRDDTLPLTWPRQVLAAAYYHPHLLYLQKLMSASMLLALLLPKCQHFYSSFCYFCTLYLLFSRSLLRKPSTPTNSHPPFQTHFSANFAEKLPPIKRVLHSPQQLTSAASVSCTSAYPSNPCTPRCNS